MNNLILIDFRITKVDFESKKVVPSKGQYQIKYETKITKTAKKNILVSNVNAYIKDADSINIFIGFNALIETKNEYLKEQELTQDSFELMYPLIRDKILSMTTEFGMMPIVLPFNPKANIQKQNEEKDDIVV